MRFIILLTCFSFLGCTGEQAFVRKEIKVNNAWANARTGIVTPTTVDGKTSISVKLK